MFSFLQAEDCVYSTVSEHSHHSKSHHKDKESSPTSQQLQRHQLVRLETIVLLHFFVPIDNNKGPTDSFCVRQAITQQYCVLIG